MLRTVLAAILLAGHLLATEVLAQRCFNAAGCTGDEVEAPGSSASDCCVGTEEGQSYATAGDCTIPQCIVHGFEQLSYTTPESDALQGINFRPNVKGTGQPVNIQVIVGMIDLEEDTAMISDISTFSPVRVSLDTNNEALNIQVIPQSDTISLELDDRINLRFNFSTPMVTPDTYFGETGEFIRNVTSVRIMDDDSLTINFFSTDYDVGEEDLIVTIEMTIREAQIPFTLTLTPTTVDDVLADTRLIATDYLGEAFSTLSETGKATPGIMEDDYDDRAFVKTIPPSTTSRVLSQNIRIKNDEINEVEQLFALVGELGSEVPEEFACFRVTFGEAVCRGRVGTTGIRIRDNDPMILGFGERRQTISEAEALSGQEGVRREIFITSLRTSEIEYRVGTRSVIEGEPRIEPAGAVMDPQFDGEFASREANTINNLVREAVLNIGSIVLAPLTVIIRDDNTPEEEECFDLSIFPVNPEPMIPNFECNFAGDEFLCEHTICIEDDDEPFRVAFDQTMYTVLESAGSVEVCVNLTHPPDDILDERVTVLVFHNDDSMYIPPNSTLATPDPPMGIFNRHNMIPRSDYEEETQFASTIRGTFIEEERRQICYNQVVYDDERLELTEAAGLDLVPDDLDTQVKVEPFYNDSVVFIIDDDTAEVGLEKTFYQVSETDGVVVVCVVIYEPDISCPIEFPFDVMLSTIDGNAVSTMDYGALSTTVMFGACQTQECVDITIEDDVVLENVESFFVNLSRSPGLDSRITLNPTRAEVQIIDNEVITTPPGLMVNDTLTGDPLMTVPIFSDPDVMEGDIITSLCYEVHGEADKFFNLVSDTCVSVNSHYSKAVTDSQNINLNIVDAIGVRAVTGNNNNECVNIQVDLDNCRVTVNGVEMSGTYRRDGITVRQFPNRVRISVPNCDNTDLVMWVFCTSGRTEDPMTWEYFEFDFIRFVVMRGLNLAEESHGLIGQFWNVPIEVTENRGNFDGSSLSDDYIITVPGSPPSLPGSPPRSFVGLRSSVTWEFERRPCLYVGNSQAGPLGEDVVPNDSVIEGIYTDYEVSSMFSPNFVFSHFEEERCN